MRLRHSGATAHTHVQTEVINPIVDMQIAFGRDPIYAAVGCGRCYVYGRDDGLDIQR